MYVYPSSRHVIELFTCLFFTEAAGLIGTFVLNVDFRRRCRDDTELNLRRTLHKSLDELVETRKLVVVFLMHGELYDSSGRLGDFGARQVLQERVSHVCTFMQSQV